MKANEETLTKDQARAFDAIKSGANVFVTGPGGVGKSYLLELVKQWAEDSGRSFVTCAPTGIAAVKIGGCTIHKAMRIIPSDPIEHRNNPVLSSKSPLRGCDLLIIDEISMCRIDLFHYLTRCMADLNIQRAAEGRNPCQLVVLGDFYQLPPVMFGEDLRVLSAVYGNWLNNGFCFGTPAWGYWDFVTVELKAVIRQDDAQFVEALNKCRVGDAEGLHWIVEHASKKPVPGAIKLFSRNAGVDAENARSIEEIVAPPKLYRARVWGRVGKGCMVVPEVLELKPGARVMMAVNEGDHVNGSMGTVVECREDSALVDFDDGGVDVVCMHEWEVTEPRLSGWDVVVEVVGSFTQIPLKLAYAATIHKSQGQTFDAVDLNPECWERGQLYTALSRLSRVEGLYLTAQMHDRYLIAPKFAEQSGI